MRKLYLHVGVHRTGTTSTQKFLRENFEVLLQNGVLYPFLGNRHDQFIRRIVQKNQTVEDFAADVDRRAGSHPVLVDSIVISDEDMSQIKDFSIFAPLKKVFDVKVVVSLRRQDLWLESWYLQNVKWQWNASLSHLPFDEFFERRADFTWIDYAPRLAHYEDVFGPGSVIAGVFESADMPKGPIAAFLNMIGITNFDGFGSFVHSNSSLTPLMSEFMRHLPLDKIDARERTIFEAACAMVNDQLKTNASKLVMTAGQRQIVMAAYAESNQLTAQRYIGREVLFNDPLPTADAVLADRTLPTDSGDLIRTFVGPLVASLGQVLKISRMARETKATDAATKPTPEPAGAKHAHGKHKPGRGKHHGAGKRAG